MKRNESGAEHLACYLLQHITQFFCSDHVSFIMWKKNVQKNHSNLLCANNGKIKLCQYLRLCWFEVELLLNLNILVKFYSQNIHICLDANYTCGWRYVLYFNFSKTLTTSLCTVLLCPR